MAALKTFTRSLQWAQRNAFVASKVGHLSINVGTLLPMLFVGLGANRYLKPGSIPSIYGSEPLKGTDADRLERLQKRSNKKLVSSLLLEDETLKEAQNDEGETLKEAQNEIEETTEPEVDQPNNEINSFSTNHQEKLHLEALVKSLQKEV